MPEHPRRRAQVTAALLLALGLLATTVSTAVGATVDGGPAAQAHAGDPEEPPEGLLADGLSGVGTVKAVGADHGAFVVDNASGAVLVVRPDGDRAVVVRGQGTLGGLEWDRSTGELAFTSTRQPRRGEALTRLRTVRLADGGADAPDPLPRTRTIADLGRFETRSNPDQVNRYGIAGLDGCAVPQPFRPHRGAVRTAPTALSVADEGGWFVADGGGNTVLHVATDGTVRVVAVLPVQRVTLTRETTRDLGLPRCAIGTVLRLEPRPTDIEQGRDRRLFVTLQPEGGLATATAGRVVALDPDLGGPRTLWEGFAGATDLAMTTGTTYVTESDLGQVTAVSLRSDPPGARSVAVSVPGPVSTDLSEGWLYVTADGPGADDGRLWRFPVAG